MLYDKICHFLALIFVVLFSIEQTTKVRIEKVGVYTVGEQSARPEHKCLLGDTLPILDNIHYV